MKKPCVNTLVRDTYVASLLHLEALVISISMANSERLAAANSSRLHHTSSALHAALDTICA